MHESARQWGVFFEYCVLTFTKCCWHLHAAPGAGPTLGRATVATRGSRARRGEGELNLQRGNWVLSRYHVITLQYSTTAGLAAISPVDILHVHKYLVTCSKPLKIWLNPRFCWRTKPSQFYLLDVYYSKMGFIQLSYIVNVFWNSKCNKSHKN